MRLKIKILFSINEHAQPRGLSHEGEHVKQSGNKRLFLSHTKSLRIKSINKYESKGFSGKGIYLYLQYSIAMSTVEDYIYSLEGNQKEIIEFLHQFLSTFPELEDKIRYKIPFYYRKSWICYLNPKKEDKVELVFLRGNELSNASGLLEAKGRKQVRGVIFEKVQDIPMEALNEILQEAIILDDTVPYASKRKK